MLGLEIMSHLYMKLGCMRHNFVFACEAISAIQLRFTSTITYGSIIKKIPDGKHELSHQQSRERY